MRSPHPLGKQLSQVLSWYFSFVYNRIEGGEVRPFYGLKQIVGSAAVDLNALRHGRQSAAFRLFGLLAMYQARRDVLIQRQQSSWSRQQGNALLSLAVLQRDIQAHACPCLREAGALTHCSLTKSKDGIYSCQENAAGCPVKRNAEILGRMARLGRLHVSAYLSLWQPGGIRALLTRCQDFPDPTARLEWVVTRVCQIEGVSRKIATLFVSAMATPELAAGVAPWSPTLNGHLAVVLDTHAARAIHHLSSGRAGSSYQAQVDWIRLAAEQCDLRRWNKEVPAYSPRLVQQSLYAYGSKSNRSAWGLPCTGDHCIPGLCPFHG